MSVVKPRFTYADYVRFPADGKRYELIHGERYVAPSPSPRHQTVVAELHALLSAYLRQHKAGVAFLAPLDVVLADDDVVQPDLLVILHHRRHIIGDSAIHGAPDILVEVLPPSTRSQAERVKRELYAQPAISEYCGSSIQRPIGCSFGAGKARR